MKNLDTISIKALGENGQPLQILKYEFMRRMKEMAAAQSGYGFYGEMPQNYNLTVNADHPLVKKVLSEVDGKSKEEVDELLKKRACSTSID